MYCKLYWDNKAKLFKENNLLNKTVRKLIVCELLKIPPKYISYYLDRDNTFDEFVINDKSPVGDIDFLTNEYTDMVEAGLQLVYQDDYNQLLKIRQHYTILSMSGSRRNLTTKKDVCDLIEKMISTKKYQRISKDDKKVVDMYEKLYFLPVELFNPYIPIRYEGEDKEYYEHLIFQWQTANEMAANISQQRSNMNNFYTSLMTLLIAGVLFSDGYINSLGLIVKIPLYVFISIIGALLCTLWRNQITNYSRLNSYKYMIINQMERALPVNVMYYEYLISENTARKKQRKTNFSIQEKWITIIFEIFVCFVPLILLIGSCKGTGIWTWIKQLFMKI